MPPTAGKSAKTRPPSTDRNHLTPTALWIGGGFYVLLVLIGFCFGVWAGNDRPKPVEVAAANPVPANPSPQAQPPAPQPQTSAPQPAPPEPMPQPMIVTPMPVPSPPEPMPKPPEPMAVKPKPPEPKPMPKIRQVSFQKEVLPVFRSKCLNCHGDVGKPKGGLDLRNLAAIAKGGDSGDALVAGDIDKSSIWALIADGSMPPAGKGRLTPEEVELIKNWILSGGK